MPKRHTVLWLLVAGISLVAGCKKSSESSPPNFFGSPPTLSEVSITKQTRHFSCTSPSVALCCVDPPVCSCCCQPDTVNEVTADFDLVQMSGKVADADGTANILVVLARFFDPPSSTGGTEEISLEMFDVGTAPVGTIAPGGNVYQILSGDTVQGDGIYTRYFYMKSTTLEQPDDCVLTTDTTDFSGTYSQFTTSSTFPATGVLNYQFHMEAVDRAGNIASSSSVTLPILESDVTKAATQKACGPPTGAGGCQPPP